MLTILKFMRKEKSMSNAIIPLCVPYWDQRAALAAGAKYSEKDKFHVDADAFLDDVWEWLPLRFKPDKAPPYLMPEMLPVSAWQENVRAKMGEAVWDKIRKEVYMKSGHRCEICGSDGAPYIEAHEKWAWTIEGKNGTQILKKVQALCTLCHKAHHLGFARRIGVYDEVVAHIKRINGWTDSQFYKALQEKEARWKARSDIKWKLDLSWLVTSGYIHGTTEGMLIPCY